MNRLFLWLALFILSAGASAQETALTPGWTARAAAQFAGASPAATGWKSLGDAGAAFDFSKLSSQALAYSLQASGVDAAAYGALSAAARLKAVAKAKEDIGHSAFELAALTADPAIDKERLGVVGADLNSLSGELKGLLDASSLHIARVGSVAAQAGLEGRTMNLAERIARELAAEERADRLAAHPVLASPSRRSLILTPEAKRARDRDFLARVDAAHEARKRPVVFLDDEPASAAKRYGSPWVKASAIASGLLSAASGIMVPVSLKTGQLDSIPLFGWAALALALTAVGLIVVYVFQDAANPKRKKWSPREDVM